MTKRASSRQTTNELRRKMQLSILLACTAVTSACGTPTDRVTVSTTQREVDATADTPQLLRNLFARQNLVMMVTPTGGGTPREVSLPVAEIRAYLADASTGILEAVASSEEYPTAEAGLRSEENEVMDLLDLECAHLRWKSLHPNDSSTPVDQQVAHCESPTAANSCSANACMWERFACIVNLAVDIATQTEPRAISVRQTDDRSTVGVNEAGPVLGIATIPVQSPEARAGLLEFGLLPGIIAASYSIAATYYEPGVLEFHQLDPVLSATDCTAMRNGVSNADRWITAIDDLQQTGDEAARLSYQAYLALADAEASRIQDQSDRQQAQALIRGYAATLLIGGRVSGQLASGLCASNLSGPGAAAALALIRESGMPMDLILDQDVTWEELITAPDGLRERIARFRGQQPTTGSLSANAFLQQMGVSRAELESAREYIKEEQRAFFRTQSRRYYLESAAGNAPSDAGIDASNVRYSSTATPPRAPSSILLATRSATEGEILATDDLLPQTALSPQFNSIYSIVDGGRPSLASSNGAISAYMRQLLYELESWTSEDEWSVSMRSLLTSAASRGRSLGVEGAVAVSTIDRSSIRVTVASESPQADLILVQDADAVHCATRGDVDGSPCNFESDVNPATSSLDVSGEIQSFTEFHEHAARVTETFVTSADTTIPIVPLAGVGGVRAADRFLLTYTGLANVGTTSWKFWPNARTWNLPNARGTQYFILRRRAGARANTPGAYEELAGGTFDMASPTESSDGYVRFHLVVPSLAGLAGQAVAPSRDNCARPAVSCSGIPMDQRVPLEDDLTDDGSSSENSWQRYLSQASVAAERADALGKEALGEDANIQERSEQAIVELQQLCGVTVSASDFSAPPLEPGQSPPPPATLEDLVARVDNPVDRGRLERCISTSAGNVVPYVTLGTDELCAWEYEGRLCGLPASYSSGAPVACPQVLTGSVCSVPTEVAGPNTVAVHVGADQTLRFVEAPDASAAADRAPVSERTCDDLRQFREIWSIPTISRTVAQRLEYERLRQLVFGGGIVAEVDNAGNTVERAGARLAALRSLEAGQQIRFEGSVGTHTTLYVGDLPIASTGSAVAGASQRGICAGASGAAPLLCDGTVYSRSLLCGARIDCTRGDNRAAFGARALRASVVARVLAQADLSGFVLPDVHDVPSTSSRSPARSLELTIDHGQRVPYEVIYSNSPIDGIDPEAFYCPSFATLSQVPWRMSTDWTGLTNYAQEQGGCSSSRQFRFVRLGGDDAWGGRKVSAASIEATNAIVASISNGLTIGDARFDNDPVGFTGGYVKRLPLAFPSGVSAPWVMGETDGESGGDPENLGVAHVMQVGPQDGLPLEVLLDGLELVCEANGARRSSILNAAIDVQGPDDVRAAAAQLEAAANYVRERGSHIVLSSVPADVVSAVLDQAYAGASSSGARGEYGAAVSDTIASMRRLAFIPGNLGRSLGNVERAIRIYDNSVTIADAEQEINQISKRQAIAQAAIGCAQAVNNVAGGGPLSKMSPRNVATQIAGAALTCSASFATMRAASQTYQQQTKIRDATVDTYEANLEAALSQEMAVMTAIVTELEATSDQIQSSLIRIDGMRAAARRSLGRLVYLSGENVGSLYASDVSAHRRRRIAQIRYEAARREAIRASFVAKLAIEQRFGLRLADVDIGMDPPPSTWEGTLCTLNGMDILNSELDPEQYGGDTGYIGDYVAKLQSFVDAYRFSYPYSAGASTAVVSLRDDVQNVFDSCVRPARNLLRHSNDLERPSSDLGPGWDVIDCNDDGSGEALAGCAVVSAYGSDELGSPMVLAGSADNPRAFVVDFGPDSASACLAVGATTPCGITANTRVEQLVESGPGRYRLSWYSTLASDPHVAAVPAGTSTVVSESSGSLVAHPPIPSGDSWYHHVVTFDVPAYGDTAVRVLPASSSLTTQTRVVVAGLQLERINTALEADYATLNEPVFQATDHSGTVTVGVCEDTDGDVFRRRSWQRACKYLCSDGFRDTCNLESGTPYCFWETEFDLDEDRIARGEVLRRSGFAVGNFNYRVGSVGVNFVGTASRTCTDSNFPSTCYSAGFINYSLEHAGPHVIRNHAGERFQADLFPATAEHSLGLAAERYLTNPLSSADRGLIEPYMQSQFRGRPVAGHYVLRVWDGPGVNFSGIEDVQLVLNYTYWTRSR